MNLKYSTFLKIIYVYTPHSLSTCTAIWPFEKWMNPNTQKRGKWNKI